MSVCFAPCPVVFDLDGTLIDSAPDIHACVNAALNRYGYSPLELNQVRGFIGGGVGVLWDRIAAACDIDTTTKTAMLSAFMTRYENATELTILFDDVAKVLGTLADRGHPLGICTNKPLAPTKAVLRHFNLGNLFQTIVAGDTQPEKKPNPTPLRIALVNLGADPSQPNGVFVGDSEYDANCAAAIGVPFLLYSEGYRHTPIDRLPHRASFDRFVQLPALVEAEA
ncbi:phosphoglycolate phosphatase [Paracoccus sp. Z330]|uniref:phosphoglycolate phosphatase n=1 Tax=Paracoccus onchidii TaxID=3017813 RepID=A0ABT4ZGX7_9RHOB|nr:phosphoglycolate phosphatase [Paracoccus onchidii]MDB6178566.1 phosphoglycolate phosphatase [Paracoccus onchidii]